MYGTLQLSMALLVLVLAIVVLSISMRFHPVAAVFMLSAQILDIPFQPHIPDYLLLVLTVNQFGLIFFLPMVVSDNLFQVLGAYLLLYVNLCIRLHEHWQMKIQWFTILFVCFMNCFIGLNMVSSILSNCKTIFHERHESQVERDNFRRILDSFSQGVVIVSEAKQDPEVLFMNQEVRHVLG